MSANILDLGDRTRYMEAGLGPMYSLPNPNELLEHEVWLTPGSMPAKSTALDLARAATVSFFMRVEPGGTVIPNGYLILTVPPVCSCRVARREERASHRRHDVPELRRKAGERTPTCSVAWGRGTPRPAQARFRASLHEQAGLETAPPQHRLPHRAPFATHAHVV